MIPYEDLAIANGRVRSELISAATQVIDSGWFILGENVRLFEEEFGAFVGVEHVVGVASGLDALELALRALELPDGGEVLVPSNTYIATILAILAVGLRPVLVEPDLRTYNITADGIAESLTERTVAILVVHLYGKSCNMGPIAELARARGIPIVEDCAQAHGATFAGNAVGTWGVGAFSFYPTKNLGALGDAGAVVTKDPRIADRVRTLRNYGSRQKYVNDVRGVNSRLDEMQAAFLRVKLPRLRDLLHHKRALAVVYFERLADSGFVLPATDEEAFDTFHIFNIRTPHRDALRRFLAEKGVGTEIHYPIPPHRQEALAGIFGDRRFPISEQIHETTVSLPISACHSVADVTTVCDLLTEFEGTTGNGR